MAVKKKKRIVESWACIGFDVSMSSISGAAIGYSRTLDAFTGPVFSWERFDRNVHYFDRLKSAGKSDYRMWDLISLLKLSTVEPDRIYIAVEEPFPFGMVGNRQGKFQSAWVKQQCQIQGAFLSGLLRQGYTSIFEINNTQWRKVIADDLGITIHHSKWDKFKPKEWALENFSTVPDLPDLINHSKLGMIPRPEGSKAKAIQPEDIYDALGMAMWMKAEANFKWNPNHSQVQSSIKSDRPIRKRRKTSPSKVLKSKTSTSESSGRLRKRSLS